MSRKIDLDRFWPIFLADRSSLKHAHLGTLNWITFSQVNHYLSYRMPKWVRSSPLKETLS